MQSQCENKAVVCCLDHALISAVSTQLHAGLALCCYSLFQCDFFLMPVFIAGMLTITDFIIILHRYYKSPMVGAGHS